MATYTISTTRCYDKDFRRCKKRGYPMMELKKVIDILVEEGSLPQRYQPHILHGDFQGIWECHIKGDWLLLWEQNDTELTLTALRTGSHSDIF